jgi:hypothetical protein
VAERDDDFLARTDPFAAPRGGGLNHGSSGYAEGLRGTRAQRRASRRDERRAATRKAFILGAGGIGAAVVAATTFTVLLFAGLFTSSPRVGGGNRPVTLVQQPHTSSTPSPSLSDATDPTPPSDTTGAFSPSNTAQAGRSPLPSANGVAVPRATAGAQRPAQPPSNSSGLKQPSSAALPPPSDAPVPVTPVTSIPNTNPAGQAPPGRNK